MQLLDVKLDEQPSSSVSVSPSEHVKFEDTVDTEISNESDYYQHDYLDDSGSQHHQEFYRSDRSVSPFQYNKRMTGKKNISNIVVGSDNKIEFDQMDDKGFGVVKINRPIGVPSRNSDFLNDSDSIHSRDSDTLRQSHTADGFFELKFYSHPLW